MNKAQIIRHTKNYMDMLAQGVDPISNEKIEADSVVLQPRMQKCFAFVAELLDEHNYVIENIDSTIIAQRPKLMPYLLQMRGNLQKTVAGLAKARSDAEREKLTYYAAALREVEEMRIVYGIGE